MTTKPGEDREWSRYSELIPDFEGFLDAVERPLPLTARVNPVKADDREEPLEMLRDAGVSLEPMDWYPLGFEVEDDVKLGNTLPHYLGLIHVQEMVSMIPPEVLDVSGDDAVLDLCAAPGGKTTQLAADAASVVANDVSHGRIPALRNNCDRLGVTNVAVENQDGRRYSTDRMFDAALVDAPCTAEGTVRKTQSGSASEREIEELQSVQKGLLNRAVELTHTGGCVVYSTCTFAPEENEAVVDHVSDEVEVEEFDVGLDCSPGVVEWNGEEYSADVEASRRFYPHQNDSGGFYVAKLRVNSGT